MSSLMMKEGVGVFGSIAVFIVDRLNCFELF